MEVKKSNFLDYKRFGEILRGARIASGYKSVEDLIIDVKIKTGYKISAISMYRIENGERALPIEAYLAFQQVMPRFFNAEMFKPALKIGEEDK